MRHRSAAATRLLAGACLLPLLAGSAFAAVVLPPGPIVITVPPGGTKADVPVGAVSSVGAPLVVAVAPGAGPAAGTLAVSGGVFSYTNTNTAALADRFSILVDDGTPFGRRFRPVVVHIGRTVAGGGAADALVGGEGGDILAGGAGNDTLTGDPVPPRIQRVSVNTLGAEGDEDSWGPAFSPDGTRVAFTSYADNMALNPSVQVVDDNGDPDVFVADLLLGGVMLLSNKAGASVLTAGNGSSDGPVFSPDGAWVAFESYAEDLVSSGGNFVGDVFLRRVLDPASMRRVSTDTFGTPVDDNSFDPVFSPDGGRIAFSSNAEGLVHDGGGDPVPDTNNRTDVFVKTLDPANPSLGPVERVSIRGAIEGNHNSYAPVFSPDGRWIAFASRANNLAAAPENDTDWDLFVRELVPGALPHRVSSRPGGSEPNDRSEDLAFAPDSLSVVFRSNADNLVDGDTNDAADIFRKVIDPANPAGGAVQRLSVDVLGRPVPYGGGDSSSPSISPDGRFLVFRSQAWSLATDAAGLVQPDLNGDADIFLKDLATGLVTRLTASVAGGDAAGESSEPVISADGTRVAFASFAPNLIGTDASGKPLDNRGRQDVFVVNIAPRGAPDLIDGGPGADAMFGGPGDDVYVVDNAGDKPVEFAGEGADEVRASVSFTLPAEVERLVLSGRKGLKGTGNGGDNVLVGNKGANALSGGGGSDTLEGGAGRDRLTGGPGNDTFVFRAVGDSPAKAPDVVTDFKPGDRIDLSGFDGNRKTKGLQAFRFIGSKSFRKKSPGQLRFSGGVLQGDVDGDARADVRIVLEKVRKLPAKALVLK